MTLEFPTMGAYIAQLPDGLASHPHLTAKGSIIRSMLADAPYPLGTGLGLPASVEELVRNPPSTNDWVPEVVLWAMAAGIYDLGFATRGGLAAYSAWAHGMNRRLLRSPAYRILFSVLSPERLFVGAAQRWSAFHRGTLMADIAATRGEGSFRLTTPPLVLSEIGRVSLTAAFRAALDLAGATSVEMRAELESSTTTLFTATWR